MKLILFILLTSLSYSQITKKDIELILVLDGQSPIKAITLYEAYLDATQYKTSDLISSIALSGASGVALGAYESKTFGYTHIEWMPGFLQNWYTEVNNSEHVLGKFFTWSKVFRQIDYSTDILAYQNWMIFWGDKWYFAILSHWIVKNTMATIIRSTYKFNEPFYSFRLNLIF